MDIDTTQLGSKRKFEDIGWDVDDDKKQKFETETRMLVVQESWHEGLYKTEGFPITNCLERCRTRLQAWNKMEYSHVGRKIEPLQSKLQMLEQQSSSMKTDSEIRDVPNALNVWLDAESTMWKQCSCNFWLTDGDRYWKTERILKK
ncbi:uncharacterized protein LOC142608797 [Castanea sativa]|uniref:uncharacterized protein LOC142608797 n=1 Tax=Castanea sativa TaxID=21020 RepID=UPI003F64C922